MPRKYRPEKDEIMFFASALSVYGMLRPVEERLLKGGYIGNVLSDYSSQIDFYLGQEKQSPLFYDVIQNRLEIEHSGSFVNNYNFKMKQPLTRTSEKEFRNYTKKYSSYLELLIRNTPPEEYPEELSELKFHQAYFRMLKVFGSRELLEDQFGFLINARGFDGDVTPIREIGDKKNRISREQWRHMRKYYPYSELRDSITELINLACDREESKTKDNYTEQIEYRENYKKALQNYIAANKALQIGAEDAQRLAKLYLRDEIIKHKKQQDGPDKDVDYYGILKRVEEQEKNGAAVDPEEKAIADGIKDAVEQKYVTDSHRFDWCNSRYGKELKAAGCKELNEMDFTGARGNAVFQPELEAQINAIDMGWPVDELIHIQRLHLIMRKSSNVAEKDEAEEYNNFKTKCTTFYNERIKDKKYPATEEARQTFYRDFYALAREAETVISNSYLHGVDFGGFEAQDNVQDIIRVKWDIFQKDMKKTMDKRLSPTQKEVLKNVLDDTNKELTPAKMNKLRNLVSTRSSTGHIDSAEFDAFKKAFTRFSEAYQADGDAFRIDAEHGLTREHLELLKKVRNAAGTYLNEKDKDAKDPERRSPMGKGRYEGASQTFLLADHLIRKHEKRLEDQAKQRKEKECEKGRRITREAFFKEGSKNVENYTTFAKRLAGGEDAYNEQMAAQARQDEEDARKEPVTDQERYEKLINGCRLKKDDPVVTEGAELDYRIENLSVMLAALELQDAGRAFHMDEIQDRAKMIRTIYPMDTCFRVVSQDPNGPNGPKMLRDALTFPFKAVEAKKAMEEQLYEVQKSKYRNTFESQNKFQADLAEVLSRKRTVELSDKMRDLVEAINEVMRINLKDNQMVGLNAYKLRKANVRIMKAVVNAFDGHTTFDKDGFAPKLALDTLAVLTTYTGCEQVTRKFLEKLNQTKKKPDGAAQDININDFTKNFGVKHSKHVTAQVRNNQNHQPNHNAAGAHL